MPMKRMRAVVSMALVAGGLLLTLPVAVAAQGLNDTIGRIIGGRPGSNCNELGGPGNTTGNLAANLCRGIPNSTDGSGAGGTPTLDSQLGQSQEQRRQADRLAERRNGQGGAADQPGTGFGLFVNGDYQFLNKDNTKFESGFEQHTAGTTVGADYSFGGRAVVGAAVSYAHEFGDFTGVGGGFDNDAFGLTLYGTVVPVKNLFVDGFVGYTRKEYSIDRRISFSFPVNAGANTFAAMGRIDGKTHSDEFNVGTVIGYDFVLKNVTVGPRVGVSYLDRRIAGYQENGDTGLELIYGNQNISSLTTTAGLFASVAINTKWGVLVPQATAEYVHEFLNDQRSVGFQFVNTISQPRFLFQTDNPDRNFFNLGIGAVFVLPGGMSTYVNVRELVGYSTRRATNVTAGLRLAF
jgi:outer membrane autotransporter protein